MCHHICGTINAPFVIGSSIIGGIGTAMFEKFALVKGSLSAQVAIESSLERETWRGTGHKSIKITGQSSSVIYVIKYLLK